MYFCPGGWCGAVHALSGTRRAKSSESRIDFESRTSFKVESFCKSRMDFSASGIPGGAFLCTFVLFGSSQNLMCVATSIRCSLNWYLAKYALKRHIFPGCGPSWGSSAGPEGAAVRMRRFASRCQSRTARKVELVRHPLPESRMILREKISGKVESVLNYTLLLHY
nr:MAG TPA: hypothetical protein [Caudoviricetes sp.]